MAFVLAVAMRVLVAQPYVVASSSMLPNLHTDDRVLVHLFSSNFSRGDIIVFYHPALPDPPVSFTEELLGLLGFTDLPTPLVKRVVGLGGEIFEVKDGQVLINSVPLAEPYVLPSSEMGDYPPTIIPPDTVFVLGDNRDNSVDSRFFGPVPLSSVIGEVWTVLSFGR